MPRGESALLCYGVENAATVWLEPPRQELSAALARCVEVSPTRDTTYRLTAEGPDGDAVMRELRLSVGAARVHLVNVTMTSLDARPGETVGLCYEVRDARTVTIDPLGFRGGSTPKVCIPLQPRKTTTYTVSAVGADGDRDTEQVTVRVR